MSDWSAAPAIKSVEASAFTIPTEQPERDGTLGGVLRPVRPGLGLEVRWPDLEQWRVR